MPVPQPLQSRLIGALFVERGLVSESQIRVALELQRETGQQLGQILVERFGVSRKELASVVAEQWAKLGGSAGPEDNASWRRLGEIFVERGFVSQEELDQALERQRQTGERLGEALVAQGVISKFELAGALAEQMAALGEKEPPTDEPATDQSEATVHHLPRTPDATDVAFGAAKADPTEVQEHLLAVPAPPTEVVPLNLATRLGLVDARPEAEPEPEPEQHEAPVEETPEPVLAEVARDDETEPALDDRAGEEVAEPVLAEAAVDDVGEPVLAEAAVEEAPESQELAEEIAEPVLADAAVDDVEEPVFAEVAVEEVLEVQDDAEAAEPDVGVPVFAEVAVEDALDVQGEVGDAEVAEVAEPEVGVPVLAEIAIEEALEVQDDAEAAEPDVGVPVFAEVAVEDALDVQDDVGEAGVAEVATEDEPEPVVAETPAEAPARRPRPLPTLVFEDAHEPETSFACVAYAPTKRGYRLVPLVEVPSPGETIDVPDVGERLVLRVGPSPLPDDDRMCAFVEEPVVWALTADAIH